MIYIKEVDQYVILYNKHLGERYINWIIAREIGHIYLEHQHNTELEYKESEYFSEHLLMSNEILQLAKESNYPMMAYDLAKLFCVPINKAHIRLLHFNEKENDMVSNKVTLQINNTLRQFFQ